MKISSKRSPRQVIKSKDDVLTFGKYKDCTIEKVLNDEPEYILWLDDEGIVEFPFEIISIADGRYNDADDTGVNVWRIWKDEE